MILQALVDYYEALVEREEIQKPGYSRTGVSYALNLSGDGELRQVIPLKTEVELGKKKVERPRKLQVPEQVIRASGIRANFLCDNSKYILGIDKDGAGKRVVDCFEAGKKLTLALLEECGGKTACAVRCFYESWEPLQAAEHPCLTEFLEDVTAGGNLIFWVEGSSSLQDPELIAAWEKHLKNDRTDSEQMQCLVTGKMEQVTLLHPKIKGVPGAQSSGANLVSFNAEAFNSYGRQQGYNAPVGEYASFAYGAALNYLLASPVNHQIVGDMAVVFWSETALSDYCLAFGSCMDSSAVDDALLKEIFAKASVGKGTDEFAIDYESKFYVLGLSPNAARVSVRFFLEDSFGRIIDHLRKHQERLEIVKPPYEKQYLSVSQLLRETVNLNSKDKTPSHIMAGSMLRAILLGTAYPRSFYNGLLMRAKAEQDIGPGRAAGIKAYLLNCGDKRMDKEVLGVKVNDKSENRAYVLGRMFAVLERAQEEANPGINSTIKDRYFSSACATPGLVFPRLLRLAGFHNAKSENGKYREKEIGELMCKLEVEHNPFPNHQDLEDQGIFMLGYYQQREQRYEKKGKEEGVE